MPTTDIIGYLWGNRQAFEFDGIPDVLQTIADLQRTGLECIRVEDVMIFGSPAGTSVQLVRREPEEWAGLIEDALIQNSIEHTIQMLHDPEERDLG